MKFVMIVVLAVVAVAQAKYMMSPNGLSASMDNNEIDGEMVHAAMQVEKLYIPMARLFTCNNAGCTAACHALGYKYGKCVSDTTCQCYN